MIHPVSGANSVYAVYQPSQVTPPNPRPPEEPPPIDQPKDTYTPSRASDLDHVADNH